MQFRVPRPRRIREPCMARAIVGRSDAKFRAEPTREIIRVRPAHPNWLGTMLAAAEFVLVEPHLHPGRAQCLTNTLRRLHFLRSLAQKHGPSGFGH